MESSSQVNQEMRAIARKSSSSGQNVASATPASSPATSTGGRSTASTSASSSASAVKHLNNSTIYVDDENRPKGHVVYFTAKRNLPPKMYKSHECNPNCLFKIVHRLDSYSPLAKPLLSGWERLVMRQKTKKCVVYRGPCGKSLRNLAEVHMYLRSTENVLNVDNFDFTPDLKCLAEYSIDPSIVKDQDISKGQEKMAIPLVNYYDNTLPPPCTYAKQRIPTEGVHLNLDEEFLLCCDCVDDCSVRWYFCFALVHIVILLVPPSGQIQMRLLAAHRGGREVLQPKEAHRGDRLPVQAAPRARAHRHLRVQLALQVQEELP